MVFGLRKKGPESVATEIQSRSADDEYGTTSAYQANGEDEGVPVITTGAEPEDAVAQLRKFKKLHRWDLHLPQDQLESVAAVVEGGDIEKKIAVEQSLLEEDSPYPEVRAAVRNYDETEMPANTIRAWVIGMLLTTIACAINLLFSLRNPSIQITTYVVQLVAYPLGLGWDMIMPRRQFNTFGVKWNLNPSPFNEKEHTIIVVMANASFAGGVAYATDILLAQQVFYKQSFGWGFQMLLVITSQMIGFGLAGMVRRFLVCKCCIIISVASC